MSEEIRSGASVPEARQGALSRVVALLRDGRFRAIWAGQAVSALGDPVQFIALAVYVLRRAGSPLALGGVAMAMTAPRVLAGLLSGALTDRFDPIRIMIACDLTSAVTSFTLAVLIAFDAPLWAFYPVLIVAGLSSGAFTPAAGAMVPRVVAAPALQQANSLMQLSPQIAIVLGAPLGGALVARAGPFAGVLVNGATFCVAALSALMVKPRMPADRVERRAAPGALFRSVWQGFRHARSTPWIGILLLMDVVVGFATAGQLSVGLPFYATTTFGAGGLGVILAGFGAGSCLGMVGAGLARTPARRGRAFCLLQLMEAPLFACMPFFGLVAATLLFAAIGALNGVALILYFSVLQERVDAPFMGRIMALSAVAGASLQPLSQLCTAWVAEAVGVSVPFVAAGALVGVASAAGLLHRSIRELR